MPCVTCEYLMKSTLKECKWRIKNASGIWHIKVFDFKVTSLCSRPRQSILAQSYYVALGQEKRQKKTKKKNKKTLGPSYSSCTPHRIALSSPFLSEAISIRQHSGLIIHEQFLVFVNRESAMLFNKYLSEIILCSELFYTWSAWSLVHILRHFKHLKKWRSHFYQKTATHSYESRSWD